jgi:hypothetical protein
MFAEDFNCQSFKKISLYFIKNKFVKTDIRYPAFGLAGYPAKTVSGASLLPLSIYKIGTLISIGEQAVYYKL